LTIKENGFLPFDLLLLGSSIILVVAVDDDDAAMVGVVIECPATMFVVAVVLLFKVKVDNNVRKRKPNASDASTFEIFVVVNNGK
jgi:hypothetical protein